VNVRLSYSFRFRVVICSADATRFFTKKYSDFVCQPTVRNPYESLLCDVYRVGQETSDVNAVFRAQLYKSSLPIKTVYVLLYIIIIIIFVY